MTVRVLIIGAYGNFGSYISKKLSDCDDITLVAGGRSEDKCRQVAQKYDCDYCVLDVNEDIRPALKKCRADIVIHTSGPFQGQGYDVAEACIDCGCHYIDLSDSRDFVTGIEALSDKAKQENVTVISGASSVPALTSAVIDAYRDEFSCLREIDSGISTAQHTNTGLATTRAVLSYAGKPFFTKVKGEERKVYGWQDITRRRYPELGWRLLGDCDVPDLGLFPKRYPTLETIKFRAGLEVPLLHMGLWFLSGLVRVGLVKSLAPLAGFLLKASRLFDVFGTGNSAFHMQMSGVDNTGKELQICFYLIAKSSHGPFIPAFPAIICTKMLARGQYKQRGAFPCVGIVSLADYLESLRDLDIQVNVTRNGRAFEKNGAGDGNRTRTASLEG